MKIQDRQTLLAWISDLFQQFDYPADNLNAINAWGSDCTDHDFFVAREQIRILIGDYNPIPENFIDAIKNTGQLLNVDHLLHCSTESPGMIAYTPSADHGIQDRQIKTKIGRYLKNNSGLELSDPQIAELSSMYRSDLDCSIKLLIAETADECGNVYANGPRSCMSGDHDEYNFQIVSENPGQVYGGPDTCVGYVERDGRITARSVINKLDRTYSTIYGDESALEPELESAGYSAGYGIGDCRLLKVENRSGDYLMPYIDGSATDIDCEGEFWRVVRCGSYSAQNECGLLEGSGSPCADCGSRVDEDDTIYIDDHGHVCESCAESYYYAFTGRYQSYVHTDSECIYEFNGEWYTCDGLSYHDLIEIDGEVYSLEDCVETTDGEMIPHDSAHSFIDSNGDQVYTDCDRNLTADHVTGETISTDDSSEILIDCDDLETAHTIESVSWSNVYSHDIADHDLYTLENGDNILDSDEDRIAADENQDHFGFYSAAVISHTDQIITSDRGSFAPDSGSV